MNAEVEKNLILCVDLNSFKCNSKEKLKNITFKRKQISV